MNVICEEFKDDVESFKDFIKTMETDIGQDDVKIPQFKGHSNWIEFKQKLILKISLIKSATGFTLDYIVDTTEREHKSAWSRKGEVEEYDPSNLESMKTKFIFFGEAFKKDNTQCWKILELNLLDTPGYNHIIAYETMCDGRNTYLSLVNFYEGEDFTTRLVDQAFGNLQAARYRGETTKFKFENFVNIHLKAHKMLVEAKYGTPGLGLDDAIKKQYLKQGITEEAGLVAAL